MNLPDAGEVKIRSRQVNAKAARCRSKTGAAGDGCIVMSESNIVERGLSTGNLHIGLEALDRLLKGGGVGSVDVSLYLRVSPASADLQRDVRRSRHRIIESGQLRGGGHVDLMQIHAGGDGSVVGEVSFLQNSLGIELGAGFAAPQRAAAEHQFVRRKLNAGRQGIPMHLLLRGA